MSEDQQQGDGQRQRNRNRRRGRNRSRGGGGGNPDAAKDQQAGSSDGSAKGGGQGGGGQGGGGGRRNKRRRGNRRRGNRRQPTVGFWGDPDKLPAPDTTVRLSDDPAAVPRSLGAPPLPGQERIAQHYFELVYERAATTAGAVAAAGGLIEPDVLVEELGSDEDE